jgi:hypothetical protein
MGAVDQREYPRFGIGLPVSLNFAGQSGPVMGELQDISRGGCFFKSATTVAQGRKVSIVFSVAPDRTCKAAGHVVRTTAYKGFAVLFEDANESIFEFIHDLATLPPHLRADFLTSVLNPEIQLF